MSLPRCFAPDAADADSTIVLPPAEAHHVPRVLRLGDGAPIRVFDGRGREWHATLAIDGRRVTAIRGEGAAACPEPPVRVTVAMALIKGDRMDAAIRDATVLGAAAIVPIVSAHVAVPAEARRARGAADRWQRVAVAAAKQCGRAVVPPIGRPVAYEALLESPDAEFIMIAVEPSHIATIAAHPPVGPAEPRPNTALLLLGPEGGWSTAELDHAMARGARVVKFGPRTLRTELAPVVALTVFWSLWGWS
jgi:16S rRNA (uracil1498-N3)-methyltransferase